MRQSHVLSRLAVVADKATRAESLLRDAYEIAHSSRTSGNPKVAGGDVADPTGERSTCECEGTDPTSGKIVHHCSPHRWRQAVTAIDEAETEMVAAVNHLSAIVYGSDHHAKAPPFEHRDRHRGKRYPVHGQKQAPADERDEDFNPAARRAAEYKAKRLVSEFAESLPRRLCEAGLSKPEAEAYAARIRKAVV